MITAIENPLLYEYKKLKELVLSNTMPWYYYDKTVPEFETQDIPFFSHILLKRPDEGEEDVPAPLISVPTSPYFEQCYNVIKQILDYNNIHFNILYRMNLNLTLNSTIKESMPHTDFCLPHKVVIVYLTAFNKGRTIVLDKINEKHYSTPDEDSVIIFDGEYTHYHECPDVNEKRIVLVANIG